MADGLLDHTAGKSDEKFPPWPIGCVWCTSKTQKLAAWKRLDSKPLWPAFWLGATYMRHETCGDLRLNALTGCQCLFRDGLGNDFHVAVRSARHVVFIHGMEFVRKRRTTPSSPERFLIAFARDTTEKIRWLL